MAKIVTVYLVVNEDDEAHITDGLNEALRQITHPMGSGCSDNSFIIDYSLAGQIQPIAPWIEESINNGTYKESSAQPQTAFYAVVIEQDVSAFTLGPFSTAEERDEAAKSHRAEFGTDDGIHTLDVHPDGTVDVGDYSGADLEDTDPLLESLHAAFHMGETPISRLAGDKHFTIDKQVNEVRLTFEKLCRLEAHLGEPLLVLTDEPFQLLVPVSSMRARIETSAWKEDVAQGLTEDGFHQWRESALMKLPLARDLYSKDPVLLSSEEQRADGAKAKAESSQANGDGGEQELVESELVMSLRETFLNGDFPICQFPGSQYFTYQFAGDEIVVGVENIAEWEEAFGERFVLMVDKTYMPSLVPESVARANVPRDLYDEAVQNGYKGEFEARRENRVMSMQGAADAISNAMKG
jgi:hypothetical protein